MFAFGHGHTDYVCVAGAGCVIGLWHGAVGGVFCVFAGCVLAKRVGSVALAPSKLADTLLVSCTLCSNFTMWRFARSSAGRRVNRLRPARF